ncbi:MAG: hypothetical protein ER33_09080 [Cyanobium sp. CACIAM 14]|nr:MAG: hypothetical protein ER33_09080 [Cyanobium sp. CACIAM 14]
MTTVLTPLPSGAQPPGENGCMVTAVSTPPPPPSGAIAYAGFWIRTAASLIDSVLLLIVTAPFPLLLYVLPSDSAVLLVSSLFSALIVILFWRWKQGTPGKLMFRLRIVDARSGGEPSLRQWILRYLGYFLSSLPLLLGFFWIAWDPRRQGWHDKLAGTVVIRPPSPGSTGVPS